jgi:hypothetical protein
VTSSAQAVTVHLPSDVAEDLIAAGLAQRTLGRRSGLMLETAGVAATVISLLQGPDTVVQLARMLRDWSAVHLSSARHGHPVVISARGPKGRVDLQLTDRTDLAEVESLLRRTVFADEQAGA